jgi:hypothetical protein
MRRAVVGVAVAIAVAAGVALSASPAPACGCGIAIDASVSAEHGLVIEHRRSQSIVLSLDLASDDSEARPAVVVPVPGDPTVAAVEGGDPLTYLEQATAPPPAPEGSGDDGATAGAGVDVIGRERIGGYDVARLGAADAGALERWLDDNGYTLPDGAEPILADYADEDWRFVAIRLARGSEGRLKPLKISFDTEQTIYPMRLQQLAATPVSLTLFVLARAERRVKGLDRTFSGRIEELEPPPPDGLEQLLDADRHLTRIEADAAPPSRFQRDLVIEPIPAPPGAPAGEEEGGFSTRDFALVGVGALLVLIAAFAIKARQEDALPT